MDKYFEGSSYKYNLCTSRLPGKQLVHKVNVINIAYIFIFLPLIVHKLTGNPASNIDKISSVSKQYHFRGHGLL